jgi:class 3 adenylate cyclase/tetratricopeptide (TPR) repeat protein
VTEETSQSELLKPYVPRLLIDWLRDTPHARWRAVEGSLAFVDISGFTKMTERLATKGKVGAEELNDTLDTTFTELLSVAYDYGAGLVKWGGDAVLLLFEEEEHALRAARAAAGMQRTLRAIGRIKTSAGLVTLRMSVGIHSDEFHFFLVGRRHRELVITGPAATRTVAMESAAEAGEVLLSPETVALLDLVNVGAPKKDGFLLKGEPAVVVERARPAPDVTGLDLAACLPETIREHLLADAEDAEHRPIATAFIEFKDTDSMLEREGPDELAGALDELVGFVQDAVHDHKVVFSETDISSNGGKILLLAGAPTSTGDDEERMLRTARAVIEQRFRLPIRIGVNRGRAFAGDFGPPYRRTYSCKGDALNTAARIMGKAEAGQALATEEVLARSRTKFELRPVGPFALKGKAEPVAAFEVGPVIGREAHERHELPLVGRERELAALLEALESARGGHGRIVELIGEPGIGKSRLVEELRNQAGDVATVVAVCEQYESSTPYHPLKSLLRALLGIRNDELPARASHRLRRRVEQLAPDLLRWLPLLGPLVDVELPETEEVARLEDRFRRAKLNEAAAELLAGLLPGPTLLVFEDVHWMDEASADLLTHLARQVGGRPWVLIPSRRDVDTGFVAPEIPEASALRLEPLDERAALALIEAETEAEPLPPHVVATLSERAAGNPLFLAELVSAARSVGVDALPDSIEALLAVQIDRLPPRDRTVLRYASVLGSSFQQDLLRASLEGQDGALDDGVWERLADFVQRDRSGVAQFRHALVRDAAYEGLPFKRRQELHGRVGETIERLSEPDPDDQAEVLSFHFFNAQRFGEAWHYSRAAGERAQAVYANAEAATFYRRALEASRKAEGVPAPEIAAAWEALGDVSDRIGAFDDAARALREARRRLRGNALAQARLLRREAEIAERSGRYVQALRLLGRGLRSLDSLDGSGAARERAQLSVWYGFGRFRQGRHRDAIPWCEQAIREAEAARDREALAWAYMVLDAVHIELGSKTGDRYGELALAIYKELGNLGRQATITMNLGNQAYYEGDWRGALAFLEQARDLFGRTGDTASRADATFNIGEILSHQGRLDEAEHLLRDAGRVWKAAGDRVGVALATSERGRVAYRSGRWDEGLALLVDARGEFEAVAAAAEVRETDVRIAECLSLQGRPEEALRSIEEAIAQTQVDGEVAAIRMPRLRRLQGSALAAAGRMADARAALEECVRVGSSGGSDFDVAIALRELAHLDGGESIRTAERQSRTILERLGVVSAQ